MIDENNNNPETPASQNQQTPAAGEPAKEVPQTETLVVVSKVKQFIRAQAQFNTSEDTVKALTRKVAEECLKGIERAKAAGRKTVMGRDIV